jgi:hypothetical protein
MFIEVNFNIYIKKYIKNMAQGRVGVRPYSGSTTTTSVDTDAQAFITAAALTDNTQKTAVNDLVLDLKSAGIWTKMKALYPMVGGTATTHKWNLKDPRDVNAAFRLSFNGSWTHSTTGVQPTNSVVETYLNPSLLMSGTSFHMSVYTMTQISNDNAYRCEMGTYDIANQIWVGLSAHYGGIGKFIHIGHSSNNTGITNAVRVSVSNTNTLGLQIGSRTSATSSKLFWNGSLLGTSTYSQSALPNNTIFLGGNKNGSSGFNDYSNRKISFASIGDGLTDLESQIFYQIVEKYQYTLGRNVNATQSFYFNRNYSNETNAFIFNAGITDSTQQSALNTLVNALKTANIWTKMKAVYPMVGGNATSHRYNLVNTSNYLLTFNGGWTHSAMGAQPNGSTGYANTGLNPYGVLNAGSFHMSYYGSTNIVAPTSFEDIMGAVGYTTLLLSYYTPSWLTSVGKFRFIGEAGQNVNGSILVEPTEPTMKISLVMLNRQTSSLFKIYKRGSTIGSNGSAATVYLPQTMGNGSPYYIYLGSSHRATLSEMRYSDLQCAFASIGDGLTDAEALTFYNAVQAFQTTLGRQV